MLNEYYISNISFTSDELLEFKLKYKYEVSEILYVAHSEIDFSNTDEKDFLLQKGYPKILARFFA